MPSVVDVISPSTPGFGNFAYDIKKWGHVGGASAPGTARFHAFFWRPETLLQDLGTVKLLPLL